MTQTSTATEDIARYAQVTLAHLDAEKAATDVKGALLDLIGWGHAELESIAAGMHNQGPEQLALQNRYWSAQRAANEDTVKVALAAGVDAGAIMAITHRESW